MIFTGTELVKAWRGESSDGKAGYRVSTFWGIFATATGKDVKRIWRTAKARKWKELSHAIVNVPTEIFRREPQVWKAPIDLVVLYFIVGWLI